MTHMLFYDFTRPTLAMLFVKYPLWYNKADRKQEYNHVTRINGANY